MTDSPLPRAERRAGADVALAERDFVAAWWLLADATGHERHDEAELRWFHTGLPDPYLNPVLVTRLPADEADAAIDGLLADLRHRGAPFTWWLMPGSTPDDLADRLAARGLVADDAWPAMILSTDAMVDPPPVPGLEIRRVADDKGLEDYRATFAPILSSSEAFTDLLIEASRAIGYGPSVPEVHFVGYLEGRPVATVTLITAGGAAGLYNVTTTEQARGRGIGAAMTAAAVSESRERGLEVASLQASTMGRPLYERLGFRHVGDFVPYHLASGSAG